MSWMNSHPIRLFWLPVLINLKIFQYFLSSKMVICAEFKLSRLCLFWQIPLQLQLISKSFTDYKIIWSNDWQNPNG